MDGYLTYDRYKGAKRTWWAESFMAALRALFSDVEVSS